MLSLSTLEKYHADGLLHKQTHPTLDLTIWNYSPKTQYELLWDEITLSCRGLVTDSYGEIVSRPFKKFFNYEELKKEDIPNEHFTVYEKMDGSFGALFNYNNQWVFSSRGSFASEQAIRGFEILNKYHNYQHLSPDNTYLFEIIYPENRIVVNYGDDEKVVLLGVFHTISGDEVDIHNGSFDLLGLHVVNRYNGITNFDLLKSMIPNTNEGYVVRFQNGLRMKIKGEEYIRLHRIVTNISSRDIWEHLKYEKPLDEILDRVPDEFYDWVKSTVVEFQTQFKKIKESLEEEFYQLIGKKEFAFKIKDNPNKHLLFKRLNSYSKELNEIIWDMLYPPYIKPFKKDE
jgi:T4 RnlA family RNA ligase